jgi:hypothetical protein
MSLRLSHKQKAAMSDCICPLPGGMHRHKVSKKAVIIPLIMFGVVMLLLGLLWPPAALWVLGILGALSAFSIMYRVIRGHSWRCVLIWGPLAAIYMIGEGIASATP